MKKIKNIFLVGMILFLITTLTADSFAQRPGRGRGRGDRAKHAKNMENLRMLKLLDVLELDEGQDMKFITAFAAFRKKTREIGEHFWNEVKLLSEILNQSVPSDEEIKAQILKIENMRIQREKFRTDFHKEVSNILTPVQLGKMVIFEHRFERELIESVRGFRERPAPPSPELDEVPEPDKIPGP